MVLKLQLEWEIRTLSSENDWMKVNYEPNMEWKAQFYNEWRENNECDPKVDPFGIWTQAYKIGIYNLSTKT